jgi:hypothetical protein
MARKKENYIKGTFTHRRTEADYMGVLLDAVPLEDWREVVSATVAAAKAGDAPARAWLERFAEARSGGSFRLPWPPPSESHLSRRRSEAKNGDRSAISSQELICLLSEAGWEPQRRFRSKNRRGLQTSWARVGLLEAEIEKNGRAVHLLAREPSKARRLPSQAWARRRAAGFPGYVSPARMGAAAIVCSFPKPPRQI